MTNLEIWLIINNVLLMIIIFYIIMTIGKIIMKTIREKRQ